MRCRHADAPGEKRANKALDDGDKNHLDLSELLVQPLGLDCLFNAFLPGFTKKMQGGRAGNLVAGQGAQGSRTLDFAGTKCGVVRRSGRKPGVRSGTVIQRG
jgi:hypothetical protein